MLEVENKNRISIKSFGLIKASLYPFLFVKIQQDKLKLTMTCQRDTIKGHHADADDRSWFEQTCTTLPRDASTPVTVCLANWCFKREY